MGRGENEGVYILAEIDCQVIPGPDIDPKTGAWKKPRAGDGSNQDAPPQEKGQAEEPPQKNAG